MQLKVVNHKVRASELNFERMAWGKFIGFNNVPCLRSLWFIKIANFYLFDSAECLFQKYKMDNGPPVPLAESLIQNPKLPINLPSVNLPKPTSFT